MCIGGSGGGDNYIGTDNPIDPNAPREDRINQERSLLERAQAALYEQTRAFTETQNKYIETIDRMNQDAVQREAARYAEEQNEAAETARTANLPNLIQTNANYIGVGNGFEDTATDSIIDASRRGRRSLRIDLQTPASGVRGSGLNVPRG